MKRGSGNTAIRLCQGTVLLAGLAIGIWRAVPTQPLQTPSLSHEARPNPTTQPHKDQRIDHSALARRSLQQVLFDPPPAPAVAVQAVERPKLELIGTILDQDRRYALLRSPNGQVQLRELGETVEGYQLAEITRGSVRLKSPTDVIDLRVAWFDDLARSTP